MKNNIILDFFLTALVIAFICSSCTNGDNKVDPNIPRDVDIFIDENQTFNMKNFKVSFEQYLNAWYLSDDTYHGFEYEHIVVDGKITASVHNLKYLGKFGQITVATHQFNDNGVITKSDFEFTHIDKDANFSMNFTYDSKGLINFVEWDWNGVVLYYALDYNDKDWLISIDRVDGEGNSYGVLQNIEYDAEGNILAFSEGNRISHDYTYENGLVAQIHVKYDGQTSRIVQYEYNSDGTVLRYNEDNTDSKFYEYAFFDDHYLKSWVSDGLTRNVYKYTSKNDYSYRWKYYYDDNGDYSHSLENDFENEERRQEICVYIEGTIDNPITIGYFKVTEFLASDIITHFAAKKEIYLSDDTLIYIVEQETESSPYIFTDAMTGQQVEEHVVYDQYPWIRILLYYS